LFAIVIIVDYLNRQRLLLNRQITPKRTLLLHRQEKPLPDADGRVISRRLTLLLHRIVTVTNNAAMVFFRKRGMSIPEARALIGLFEAGPLRIGGLADVTCIDFSTLSHLLRRLERRGMVARGRDDTDYRSVLVKLTTKGRKIAADCRKESLLHEETLIGGLNSTEVESLKDTLEQIYANAVSGFGRGNEQHERDDRQPNPDIPLAKPRRKQ